MKTRLLLPLFVSALVACTSDAPDAAGSAVIRAGGEAASAHRAALSAATVRQPFASLPDRGDLVAYAARAPLHSGPSTWHRAEVSEEHALRAAVTGSMRVRTPDGGIADYRFQRHEEHANGNWSWIGALDGTPGAKAIITFGEHAVFGQLHVPGREPLQITTRAGATWIVESDPRALRGVGADEAADYLVAPAAVVPGNTAGTMAMSAAQATATVPVIDLVLGYTSGFAASVGGQSQAVTKLTQLVTITNEAYASSQLAGKVRLVHTLQVSYPDNTDNKTALEELTGSNGTSKVAVPPSLAPLRDARERYGADLVSLVRKYSDPENNGCGIAWLIGGNSSGYSVSHAPWAYSVVSDGTDGGYYCRQETLAHELSHNLGQNHNVEDSDGDSGVHPYSYGYRESSATGFYTIMAYRMGSSQYAIPYFANPNVRVDGRPTGSTGVADNVRSMAQTLPVAAGFRATAVPLGARSYDFNGDGVSDILWRNAGDGRNSIWRSANSATPQAVSTVASHGWTIAGVGDFNGDGVSDILWRNTVDGRNSIWRSGNSATPQAVATVAVQAWKVVGVGDFNGDGMADILWRNSTDGRNSIWRSGNSATPQAMSTVASQTWQVAGVGDFNGDGISDILWRNSTDGRNSIWRSGNSATPQVVSTVAVQAWKVVGVGDFNGDGVSDVLWRNAADGRNSIWRSANAATPQAVTAVGSQDWKVAGVADFNGDGVSDVLWRNGRDGRNSIWRSANASAPQAVATVPLNWRIQ